MGDVGRDEGKKKLIAAHWWHTDLSLAHGQDYVRSRILSGFYFQEYYYGMRFPLVYDNIGRLVCPVSWMCI